MAKKSKVITKIEKKNWVALLAPKLLDERVVGEAYVNDAKTLMGKQLKINLMTITNDIKKQNINVTLKVSKVNPDSAFTELIAYEIVPSSIRRLVRRGRVRIDYVLSSKTKNGKNIRIKLFIITNAMTHHSVSTKIRKITEQVLKEYIAMTAYEAIVRDVLSHKIQNDLREKIRKVYPIRVCEVRMLEIEKERFHTLEKKNEGEQSADEIKPIEEAESQESEQEEEHKKSKPKKESEESEEAQVAESEEESEEISEAEAKDEETEESKPQYE